MEIQPNSCEPVDKVEAAEKTASEKPPMVQAQQSQQNREAVSGEELDALQSDRIQA
jgi:hypothetical protein